MTSFEDLLSVDFFGYTCVPEENLNSAFSRADKPVQVPQTCIPSQADLSDQWLSWAQGRPPTREEIAGWHYRWKVEHGVVPFDSPPLVTTPLPAASMLTLSFIAFLMLWSLLHANKRK